ncbi:AbrB/MazE/SpoVT family DNA-binding domain-containing protein [Sphingosinithalassobacter sp. CS137]|uniref:AbrB/MazE/SpoVT family DNA-binding domain-containing protein n=1 Tax=Sphingosinithalassobacter sp. CS137 TaxID=2762748 RepID=UPI00165D5064|nr:AbrB/MazE/SpoVT family DNA-binding domain-containing protein [Sphingosinithalassobacter sp. CS137]
MTEQRNLTVKGQVTIPKDVRDALGLKPGDAVAFERDGARVYLRKGESDERDTEARRSAMRARLAEARKFALPLIDMTSDDYMAAVREPVPIIRKR